ncbi:MULTISPECIES: hypothetical protein [unclassified Pseudovibrio]|uniref:hypothetical protein n=1 Tax=unclassified Pseudovibrio TaxID=2627060 RepID=UPI0007B25CE7|nr:MULTISPECIES: hypothetical protein [unclassified Pseudovibrio]KZK95253.1 hypothetical protein PsW74_04037 [Pseudovibrio sp. W74]KZL10421.1 hypothetical protein PsAD14_01328 [Pseudovibrio sp. Ad14]
MAINIKTPPFHDTVARAAETASEGMKIARGVVRPPTSRPGTRGRGRTTRDPWTEFLRNNGRRTPPQTTPKSPSHPPVRTRRDQIIPEGKEFTDYDPDVVVNTPTRTVVKKKKRRKNCCKPDLFANQWLRRGNSIYNKFNHNIDFSANDFKLGIPGRLVKAHRGFAYQYWINKDFYEYKATGLTVSTWADGYLRGRCWLEEAKYTMENSKKYHTYDIGITEFYEDYDYVNNSRLEEREKQRIANQFAKYGSVCNAPAPIAEACWNISLRVDVSQSHEMVYFYTQLLVGHDIEGEVLYRSPPNTPMLPLPSLFG